MLLKPETEDIQAGLAGYCRTGNPVALPGLTPGRVQHYRRLVYNVVEDNLTTAYPIASGYLGEEVWHQLVEDFFASHSCETPQVWKLPYEFYQYQLENNTAEKLGEPHLHDLLLFEWMEIEVFMMEDEPWPAYNSFHYFNWEKKIVLNPEFRLFSANYPVHTLVPAEAKKKPGHYFVLVFREPQTGNVQFVDLSVFFAWYVEQAATGEKTAGQILDTAAALFAFPDLENLRKATKGFLEEMHKKGFLLGMHI